MATKAAKRRAVLKSASVCPWCRQHPEFIRLAPKLVGVLCSSERADCPVKPATWAPTKREAEERWNSWTRPKSNA